MIKRIAIEGPTGATEVQLSYDSPLIEIIIIDHDRERALSTVIPASQLLEAIAIAIEENPQSSLDVMIEIGKAVSKLVKVITSELFMKQDKEVSSAEKELRSEAAVFFNSANLFEKAIKQFKTIKKKTTRNP